MSKHLESINSNVIMRISSCGFRKSELEDAQNLFWEKIKYPRKILKIA